MDKDPIAILLSEHRSIMSVVENVRRALPELRSPGDLDLHLSALIAFGQTLAVDIPAHARKEDEILFPALEAIIGEGGPTVPFRDEHREIHAAAIQLSRVIHELNEVEHPAIVAGSQNYGEQLRNVQSGAGGFASFVSNTRDLIDLLDRHFAKEEQMLFPMAESILPEGIRTRIAGEISGDSR